MSIDAWIGRRLAEQLKRNLTKYDEAWKPIQSWVQLSWDTSTMAGITNQELKYYDRKAELTPVIGTEDAAYLVVGLNYGYLREPGVGGLGATISGEVGIVVGTDVSQRIGNEVTFKKLRVGLLFSISNFVPVTLRCIILRTRGIPNVVGGEFPLPGSSLLALNEIEAITPLAQLAPRAIETQKSAGQVLWEDFITLNGDTKMEQLTCEIDLDFTSK